MGKTISCSVLLALISCFYLLFATALDTITPSKSIKDPEFVISQNGVFQLGFFSLANSSNRYVGILHNQIPVQTVVWVANRNRPLKDSSGILNISDDGNLVVSNGKAEVLWSSHVTNTAPNATTAQILDSGNLISTDVKKGRKVEIKSWKSPDDPSDGNFSLGIEPFNILEVVIWNNNELYFRSEPWNGNMFLGLMLPTTVDIDGDSMLIYFKLDSQGKFIEWRWDAGKGNWTNRYSIYLTDCDVYGKCGAFGIFDSTKRPICSCLEGTTPLQCQRDNKNGSGAGQGDDGFLEMKMMKVPAFPDRSSIINRDCKDQCVDF
ncbi:hypothetical protein ES332_D01G036700v1, partial [Gossypium tomentosum]